jgi:hypothetical protein
MKEVQQVRRAWKVASFTSFPSLPSFPTSQLSTQTTLNSFMTTRLSKIARLPKNIREELNHRLEDGQLSRTILPWVNELPETKEILAEIFHGNAITHQNLSEWRATGYQDWLFHQDRLQWFSRLEEEDTETSQHDGCTDTYEAMSRFFIFEVGQAMEAARKIKNPQTRWARVEPIMEKFTRLQNSYNWSRRVGLEYDKCNEIPSPGQPSEPVEIESNDALAEEGGASVVTSRSEINNEIIEVREAPAPLGPPASRWQVEATPPEPEKLETKNPEPETFENAPRNSETADEPASPAIAGDCGSPQPPSEPQSPNSDLPTPAATRPDSQLSTINSQLPLKCQPLPTPARTPHIPSPNSDLRTSISQPPLPKPSQPPTWKNHKVYSLPIRPRRFRCVEG